MKTERMETRLDADQRRLLEEAASARGQSLSGFVLSAALAEADAVLRSAAVTVVPEAFAATFRKLLDAPPGALARSFERLSRYEPLAEEGSPIPVER